MVWPRMRDTLKPHALGRHRFGSFARHGFSAFLAVVFDVAHLAGPSVCWRAARAISAMLESIPL